MRYNTGNPVEPEGSSDPRDLYDNSQVIDKLVNGSDLTWLGRLGKVLKTWAGMTSDFTAMMASFGYEPNHLVYVDGQPLQVDRTTQLIDYNGGVYRAKMPTSFPLTLTGSWASDSAKLVDVGDQSLRMQLAGPDGAKDMVGGALFKGEAMDPGNTAPGTSVTRGYVHAYYPEKAGAFRVGGSDLTDLNDERNFFRGLPSRNAWGDPANIGLYSSAFGRNGAAFATYSGNGGHDCVNYGTASLTWGAGNCTGNPDTPNDPFTGYCAVALGKNNLAAGQKCAAIGAENTVNSNLAMGLGYGNTLQPSVDTPDPVAPTALGRSNTVGGQGHAIGNNNSVIDGIVLGDHISGEPEEVTIGYQSNAIRAVKPSTPGGRGTVAINRTRAVEADIETAIDLGNGKTLGVTIDDSGSARISLRGLTSSGASQPIADFVWTNPNLGAPLGELSVRMNGRSTVAFGLLANGTPIFQELKDAAGISGAPSGSIYKDAGVIKVVP